MEYSDEVLHAAERASALTNQLLAFSRRQVAIPRVVDLNEIVLGIDKMLRRIIGEDIQLEVRLSRGTPGGEGGPLAHRPGDHEPGRQFARRHAGRRQADHRDGAKWNSPRNMPAATSAWRPAAM